jgi:hypothetical protein
MPLPIGAGDRDATRRIALELACLTLAEALTGHADDPRLAEVVLLLTSFLTAAELAEAVSELREIRREAAEEN